MPKVDFADRFTDVDVTDEREMNIVLIHLSPPSAAMRILRLKTLLLCQRIDRQRVGCVEDQRNEMALVNLTPERLP
jgi:hypothetical protein